VSRLRIVGAAMAAIALLVSLSGVAAAANPPTVRLWNVISTKVTADLVIDGKVVLRNITYGTVSDSVEIAPGPHDIILRDSSTHGGLATTGGKFPNGSSTTVALFYPTGANVWRDQLQTIDDSALLRVFAVTPKTVNLSPIEVAEAGDNLGEIPYFTIPTDYFELTAGTHHLQLVNGDNGNVFFHFPVTVEAGVNYTAFIWDDNGTTRVTLVVDAESASNTAAGVTAGWDAANSIIGLGILLAGFASWLAFSTAWRRKRLG
jgi:hypothetical protein